MSKATSAFDYQSHTLSSPPATRRIPIVALGMALASVIAVSYVLCVLFDLWFPTLAMNSTWTVLLPGFTWISWSSFFLGLAETFAYGWYFALLFGPLYNFFANWSDAGARR